MELFRPDQLQNGLLLRNLAYNPLSTPLACDGGLRLSVACPFCRPDRDRVLHDDSLVFVLRDGFPVSPGHVLVIPHRHVGSFFETTPEERRAILGPLQKDQCFYCDARLRGRGAVDHFVPWRRYPVDLAHNFVLADDGCNSRKSDLLADVPFLERWLRRNEDAKDELTASFIARHLPFDFDASRQVTRWAYAQVEHTGGQVWAPEMTYKPLGGEWRSVFDLSRSSP